jgi:hypothetical protein
MIHPCKCTAGGNGGQQCYNCLNGAHDICSGKPKCKSVRAKQVGMMIVVKTSRKKTGMSFRERVRAAYSRTRNYREMMNLLWPENDSHRYKSGVRKPEPAAA